MDSQSTPARARTIRIALFSYGHANGPIIHQPSEARYHKTLAYNIRHLPNPPRHLRVKSTGLSRRLQKEFLQNDNVEAFLVKVQGELSDAVKEGCARILSLFGPDEHRQRDQGPEERSDRLQVDVNLNQSEDVTAGYDADVDLIVTICCEEGRHRSVAFVEELARRLAIFSDEDTLSDNWQLDIRVMHRDIGDSEECDESVGQKRRPNKAQAKNRQRERREKGNRYTSRLEGDVYED
ncbi:hypothetical protein BJX64DRAFT_263833 [Aspergillus heterothallicus]